MKKALTLFGLLLAIPLFLNAQSSITNRTNNAEFIFEGKVIAQQSFWNSSRTKIFTAHQIQVSKSFKGNVPQLKEIITHGGSIDGLTHHYFHGKQFVLDDEGIFFCKKYSNSDNPSDEFVMVKGQSGFIQYNKSGYELQAFDNLKTYKNIQNEIVGTIINTTGTQPEIYGNNYFEQVAEEWINSSLNVFTNTDTVIQFAFDNIQVIGTSEVEFDILAKSNINNVKFASSDVYLQYSTNAFGNHIVQNDRIEASKETIIDNQVYTLELADDATDIVKFLVNSGLNPSQLYPISQNFEKFLHVRIDIQNIFQLASISFQSNLMTNESIFYNETTGEYVGFDQIGVTEPIYPFLVPDITSFDPLHISAGTESILNIHGTEFGTEKGNVVFQNGDEPLGAVWTSDVKPVEIVTWNETLIQVKVPSVDEGFYSGRPASTGTFKIVLPNGGLEALSDEWLLIDYAVFNYRITPTSESAPIFLNISDNVAGDGNADGTMNFWLDNDLNGMVGARMVTNQALCDWNTKTNIKWGLNPMPSSNTTFANNDNINLLYLAGENEFTGAFEDAFAKTTIVLADGARLETCNVIGGLPQPFLREVDIAFRENPSNANTNATGGWNFEMNQPMANQMDFYSIMIHELGHAHLLMHARRQGQVMETTIGVGDNERAIMDFDEAGGEYVLIKSKENFDNALCPNTIHEVNQEVFCSTTSVTYISSELENIKVSSTIENNQILIENNQENDLGLTVYLYDPLGRKLINRNLYLSSKEKLYIPLNKVISSGVYFVSIGLEDDNVFSTHKVIKP